MRRCPARRYRGNSGDYDGQQKQVFDVSNHFGFHRRTGLLRPVDANFLSRF